MSKWTSSKETCYTTTMAKEKKSNTVAEQRNYRVLDVQAAKKVALLWLQQAQLQKAVGFGLPEVDDRYHVWRVPLLAQTTQNRIGEVVIDAYTSLILADKTTSPAVLEARLLGRDESPVRKSVSRSNGKYALSSLRNTIAQGDCAEILQELPAGSVDLIFTSPPNNVLLSQVPLEEFIRFAVKSDVNDANG